MGTRSLTYVYDSFKNENGQKQNEPIICLYRQYDGYVSGHGLELAEFLANGNIVNGLGTTNSQSEVVWNGMGCLAASLVAHFKKVPGNFYLHAPILNRDDWQEFEYHVFDNKVIVYSIGSNNDNVLFEGDYQAFAKFCRGELKKELTNEVKFDVSDKDTVKSLLREGESVITFEKADGSIREMRCTLDEGKIPVASLPKQSGKVRATNDEVQPVFDLDNQHWKSFRWDSLVSFKAA